MASNSEADPADVEFEDAIVLQNHSEVPLSEETPACQSCRKKKSKCSRQQPCSQCVKSGVECTYEDRRMKGGIKTGVVERLNHRIDALESMFIGQGIFIQQFIHETGGNRVGLIDLPPPHPGDRELPTALRSYTDRLKQTYRSLAANDDLETVDQRGSRLSNSVPKRKREYEPLVALKRTHQYAGDDLCSISPLPKEIDDVLITYFKVVHPWVPVLHPSTFVRRARDPQGRSEEVNMILRAIVAVATKYARKEDSECTNDICDYAEACRQEVIVVATESNSIASIQALQLIALDTISTGRNSSPWSLVSLITRKVEELQLNLEDASPRDSYAEYFQTTSPSLQPATTWLEIEGRRRVFWATFLMDRFCSIVTKTKPTISSKVIRRRLPCEGYMWESDQCVETSYFKANDQPQNDTNGAEETSPFSPFYATKGDATTTIGGFAYTIEATESLSLITKFNHQHNLEPESASQLSAWLNRFCQLDSHLLQWELCLTNRWRDVRVVNGYIDPNLTVAHMTHNAAIITLHQQLAHPQSQSKAWLSGLVSAASREACIIAAKKIDKISRRYLAVSDGIAPHQFAFCLFVAGQVLLAQASHYAVPPPDEVGSMISSLNEVSRRLSAGSEDISTCPDIPAAKLARALAEERDRVLLSSRAEASTSKFQQQTPFPDFHYISNAADILSVPQHCVASPSSGVSPGGLIPFSHNTPNPLGENVMNQPSR